MLKPIKASLIAVALTLGATSAWATELSLKVYNPGEKAIFPVSSTLVMGEKDALLVDAQFGVNDGKALVEMVRASGKNLTTIYISGGDPDFYFGLEPLVSAFPTARVVASKSVVEHIRRTKDAKLSYWGPILGENAPHKIIVPTVLDSTFLSLENQRIDVKEIDTHQAYLWAPSIKTAFGGVSVSSGIHVWTADSQTPASRSEWIAALERLIALKPVRVIPGHYLGSEPKGDSAVRFTQTYLRHYEHALVASKNSTELVASLKKSYPTLPEDEGMVISAKVNKGEMKW